MSALLPNALRYLASHPLADLLAREIVVNETPKVLITRTKDERLDEAWGQYGTSIPTFGVSLGAEALFKQLEKPLGLAALKGAEATWYKLGKSLGLYSAIASTFMGMVYVRNVITASRIGAQSYKNLVGEGSQQEAKAVSNEDTEQFKSKFKRWARHVFTAGAVGLVGFPLLGLALTKAKVPVGAMAQALDKHWSLPNGKLVDMKRWPQFWVWAVPGMAAYISASRDKYENKELYLKLAAMLTGMFVIPHTTEKWLEGWAAKGGHFPLVGNRANAAYMGKCLTSLIFLSATPTLANIFLTHSRVKRDEEKAKQQALPPAVVSPPLSSLAVPENNAPLITAPALSLPPALLPLPQPLVVNSVSPYQPLPVMPKPIYSSVPLAPNA
jgi:hypothetical protein